MQGAGSLEGSEGQLVPVTWSRDGCSPERGGPHSILSARLSLLSLGGTYLLPELPAQTPGT